MNFAGPPSTIPALIAVLASTRTDHDAIATSAQTLSYAELERQTARMARALLAQGAGKGSRVALLAPDGIFWLTTFLATLRIGCLLTVMSTLCAPRELAHMLRHSDVQFLISARRFLSHDYAQKLAEAFPDLAEGSPGRLRLCGTPFLRSVWFDDAGGVQWAGSVSDLLASADARYAPNTALLNAVEAQVTAGEDAVIVYTSGSTSLPKAVVHTHWTLCHHPAALARIFMIKPEDRMLPMLPAFWLGGMAMALQVLSQGATLVYPEAPQPEAMIDAIRSLHVNRVNGWGDGLMKLRGLATSEGIDIDAILGLGPFRDASGDVIPAHLHSGMLGMSESFSPHSAEPLNVRLPEEKPGAAGRSVNDYERRVVDPDTGIVVSAGTVGELQLRGGALMSGFYKKRRGEVFTPDGFYPTGDLVRIDDEGYLTFVARRNDMIKTRSANVSRLEVEAALNELPEVDRAVVTGLPDPEFGEVVAAAIVLAKGASPSPQELRDALRKSLSSYKLPRRFIFVGQDDIPLTDTGKVKLHELGKLIAARTPAEAST